MLEAVGKAPEIPGDGSFKRRQEMVKVALLVRLEAKPGKEAEVESFLKSGLPVVQDEPATTAWFGIKLGPSTFGIFDAFPDEAGRQAHLTGRVAAALMAKGFRVISEATRYRTGRCSGGQAPRVKTPRASASRVIGFTVPPHQ